MRTRSGVDFNLVYKPKVKHKKPKGAFLTMNMIRSDGNNTPHICSFCISKFSLNSFRNWLQCPQCKDVSHEECIYAYCRKAHTSPTCPLCKLPIPVQLDESGNLVDTDIFEKWGISAELSEFLERESESESESESEDDKSDVSV